MGAEGAYNKESLVQRVINSIKNYYTCEAHAHQANTIPYNIIILNINRMGRIGRITSLSHILKSLVMNKCGLTSIYRDYVCFILPPKAILLILLIINCLYFSVKSYPEAYACKAF